MAAQNWQLIETWLDKHSKTGSTFSSAELAVSLGITRPEASQLIQAYLGRQRGQADTAYILKRKGRTTGAVWSVGQRKQDLVRISETLVDDMQTKIRRAYQPDLRVFAKRNPRQARHVETILDMLVNGAMVMVAAAVQGVSLDGDDE